MQRQITKRMRQALIKFALDLGEKLETTKKAT